MALIRYNKIVTQVIIGFDKFEEKCEENNIKKKSR